MHSTKPEGEDRELHQRVLIFGFCLLVLASCTVEYSNFPGRR